MVDTSNADVLMANLTTIIAKAKKHDEFCERLLMRLNWPRLHRQKITLINVANDIPENDYKHERLHGIVELLDTLQDLAVDVYGLSKVDVFDNQLEAEGNIEWNFCPKCLQEYSEYDHDCDSNDEEEE